MSQRKRVNFQHGMARHMHSILKQAQTFEDNAPRGLANELHNKYKHLNDDYESDKKQNQKRVFYTSNLNKQTKSNPALNHYNNVYHPTKKMKHEHNCKAEDTSQAPLATHSKNKNIFTSRAKEQKIDNSYGGQLLQNALSKFSSRGIVLLIEHEIERFVTHCIHNCDTGKYVLLFPTCNGWFRLLIHQIAQRFGCITKSYGDGENRRIIIYCNTDTHHAKGDRCVPAKLKDIYAFIPVLKLSDLFVYKYHETVAQSKQYYVDWFQPNTPDACNAIVLQRVDIEIEVLSHDIVCEHAMFVYHDWEKLFASDSDSNWKKESNDIDPLYIGCNHMFEVESKESKDAKCMQLFVEFVKCSTGNEYDNCAEIRQIDMCHSVVLLRDMHHSDIVSLVKKFYKEYSLYQDMISIHSIKNASDFTKYFSGFVCMVMNKKRGARDTTVAKRMIAYALTGSPTN